MNFRQRYGEPLHDAWDRFHRKLSQFPNHEILGKTLLQIFYWALEPLSQAVVNDAAEGSLLNLHFHVATKLLREVLLRVSCREELKKMKRVVQYAVFDAYNLSLETLLLNDEGASLPTSISIPEKTFADNAISVITYFSVPVRSQAVANDPHFQLICTVTPASSNMEETHNTLKFASRAKRVKIYLSRNKLEEGQVKIQSRLEEEEDAKDALLSQIQKLTKLIFVSLKNSIPGSRFSSSDDKLNSSVPIESKNQRDASSKTSDFNHERSSSKLNDDISQAGSVIIYSTQAGEIVNGSKLSIVCFLLKTF
ncbi:hypothetical protein T459_27857 [Capsicum annuum]|uniref:Kinesin motor domain-containing protein n=1 Tax=Capsicum annuum TaxID=4072 RepID=A0A2G2YF51_CAPAN|nr:hypothetical protein T459_27857 [Capsicum annuum]